MPHFTYHGRDKEGNLRAGQRFALTADNLNTELIREGISPIQIIVNEQTRSYWAKLNDWLQGEARLLGELSIFSRQMQLLHDAGVPMVTALKQLSLHTRSKRLSLALLGIIEHLEEGQSLATAMQYYPHVFSQLLVNIIQIGENTGQLSQAFAHIHEYLDFEIETTKQIKSAFRYPTFVLATIIFAIAILNIFVIPSFSNFFVNLQVSLPWETRLLIGISNIVVHDGIYLLVVIAIMVFLLHRYLKTPRGKYLWNKYELHIPFVGKLVRRIILIRFCQASSITLNAGISITQGLTLVKNTITNAYIAEQISKMQEAIERGIAFTQAIMNIDLFSSLEVQILSVGEKKGELSGALGYISNLHRNEIEFDLKRMHDIIGPVLIGAVSGLILIIALGVYLPIWNMINLVH